jgi:hypothetical protein
MAAKDAILAPPEVERLIDMGALRMVGPGPDVLKRGTPQPGVPTPR